MHFPKTGILGGGQLGLMMAQACSNWHFEPVFLDPDPKAPVRPYGECVTGSFRDAQTVLDFGSDKELLSFEIEDVSLPALKQLAAGPGSSGWRKRWIVFTWMAIDALDLYPGG